MANAVPAATKDWTANTAMKDHTAFKEPLGVRVNKEQMDPKVSRLVAYKYNSNLIIKIRVRLATLVYLGRLALLVSKVKLANAAVKVYQVSQDKR